MSDDMIRQRLWGKTDICALFTALKAMDRGYKGLQVLFQWANILIGVLI